MTLKEHAKKLKTDLPAVFLALKRKDTPWYAKIAAAIVVIYALSPIDFIPDFIPIFGYLDDVILLPVLIALTVKLIPKSVFMECQAQSSGMWEKGKPKKWIYTLPFALIWIVIIVLLLRAFI